MKNTIKLLGIIALVAVIGFSLVACGDKEVVALDAWGSPDKDSYWVGDTFDPTGVKVLIKYSNGNEEVITSGFASSGITWTVDMSTRGQKEVTAKHTASGLTKTFYCYIYVYPTEGWTQADFYGTWKSISSASQSIPYTVTITADSVAIVSTEYYGSTDHLGTYTISNWGTVTKTAGDPISHGGNSFKVDITSSTNHSYSVSKLEVSRGYENDSLRVDGISSYGYIAYLEKQ